MSSKITRLGIHWVF